MKVGLTLGKFAPLHRGHQYLIETALAACDHLILLIYDSPEVTAIPLPMRAAWVRELYPQVEVLECYGGPREVGDTADIKRAQEDYVLNRLAGRRIDRFFCSEFYGEHMSRALQAEDWRVDPARLTVPVSGTQVRAAPFACRHWLHPRVYRDLVTNVVFLGAPSTGKTTLCRALAEVFETTWMPEYGREYWERHQIERRLTPEQLLHIAEGHLEREEAKLLEADRFLFTDTNAFTTWHFCRDYHTDVPARLKELAARCWSRYQRVFVCATDIPYEDSWDRSGEVQRERFQKELLAELGLLRIDYIVLRGNLEARIDAVREALIGNAKDFGTVPSHHP